MRERLTLASPPAGGLARWTVYPIAIKDVIDTAGVVTTYGSIKYRDHRPDADAHVVQQLRNAGAVILGKTNTHELARGITNR